MKRFRILMAVLLACVLSFPMEGETAFANGGGIASGTASSAATSNAAGNGASNAAQVADGITAITDSLTNRG